MAQPLFDIVSKYPNFLAFRGMDGLDIVLFALAIALVPPLLMVVVEAAVGLAATWGRRALHLLVVAALTGLIAIQALKKIGLDPALSLIALAVAAGGAGAILYDRTRGARLLLTALAPAAPVFLALFLFTSPVNDLVFAKDVDVSDARVPGNVPVVMVVFDELSTVALEDGRQQIDRALFPNFASLARDATWFRNATAPADETSAAMPALMTGSLPEVDGLPVLSQYPNNLFTFLGGSYRLVASQEASDLCPRRACYELTRGSLASRQRALASDTAVVLSHLVAPPSLAKKLPSVSQTIGGFAGDKNKGNLAGVLKSIVGGRPERFQDVVETIRPRAQPTLYFKHSLLPHVPFQYLPSGRIYAGLNTSIPGLEGEPGWKNDYLRRQAYQRHLLQTQFADRLLGALLRRLRERALYQRALIVVTSDGGESFLRPADRNAATMQNVEDIAATPLLIKPPGRSRGRIADWHVRTIDILPTIADLLHARLPWKVDGRSAWTGGSGIPQRIEMLRKEGDPLELSFAEFKRRVRASVKRKQGVFGSGGRGPGLYDFGPHRELLGRPVAGLAVRRSDGVSAKLLDADAYKRVDLESGFVPAHITGNIGGPTAPGRDLAFAVNGQITGVAPTFKLAGSDLEQFSILVSERAFRAGKNTVEVLWVRRGGRAPVLQHLGGSD